MFPSLVVGRFDANVDQDWFEFKLEAKMPVAIEVVSDRLGERTDPQLIVYRVEDSGTANERLTQIAIADDIANTAASDVRLASRDAVVLFTPPESGAYRLMVRDQQRSDSRSSFHRYALELRKSSHDVSAVAYFSTPTRDITKSQNLAPTISRNGTLAVAIAVARHDGWKGPVEVQAEGLPLGISSAGISLATDQTHGHLVFVAAPDAVAIQRREGGKQPVIIRLRNSPTKTKTNDLTVNADANNAELEINVPHDAPLGEYTCWAQCESKIKLSLNPQALEREQKRLDELQSKKSQLAEGQAKDLEVAIAAQQEKIRQVQEQTKQQEFLVQLPSTTTRFRIVDKP